jgi:hypothetical protein
MLGAMGAGAAASLEDLLKQKFIEQIQKQKLAEEIRQADMQHGVQQRQLGQGDRRIGLDEQKFGLDEKQFGESTRQFDVSAGFKDRGLKLDETEQPVRLRQMGAQTAEIERKPLAEQQEREFVVGRDKTRHGFDMQQLGAQQAGAIRLAQMRQQGGSTAPEGGQSPYAQERNLRNLQSVSELQKKVGPWTTGGGSLLASIPATDARNFKAELDTLKANIAFGELTAMREASKTGGALGAVSEREMALLSAALGALDPGQSPSNFKAQLQKVADSIQRWEAVKSGGAAAPGAGGGKQETPEQRLKRLIGGG